MAARQLCRLALALAASSAVAVVDEASCGHRLDALRALVREGRYDEAFQQSAELDRSDSLPSACQLDKPYIGKADIVHLSDGTLQIQLLDPSRPFSYDLAAADEWALITDDAVAVEGFSLDGQFVLSSHAEMQPGSRTARQRRAPGSTPQARQTRSGQLQEPDSYALGVKKLLVLPVCPNISDRACFEMYNRDVIAGSYGGEVVLYMQAVVNKANTHLSTSSWGQLSLDPTILSPLRLTEYSAETFCSDIKAKHFGTLDQRALAKAEAEDPTLRRADFDFYTIVIPSCSGLPWYGIAYVGQPGIILHLFRPTTSLDPALVHEVGHNFGLNHAATLSSLSRGRAIADTAFLDDSTQPRPIGFKAQGSRVSPLGSGGIPDAHYMLPGKLILDWLPGSAVAQLDTTAGCAPCGPYLLQPTDTGVVDASSGADPVGIRIATSVPGRYFWVEARTTASGGVPSVLVSSASISYTQGRGGVVGATVLADTADADPVQPFVAAGQSLVLDLGSSGSPRPLQLRVAGAGAQLLEVVLETPEQALDLRSPDSPSSPPPSPPPPSPSPPLPAPPSATIATVALDSCSTTLSRQAPLSPVVNSPSACLGTGFTAIIGTYGSSSALLHFKLPDGLTAGALVSAKLSFYVAGVRGGGPGVRLDGLGTRTGDEVAVLALQSPGDFHVGDTDQGSGVTEIDPLAMRWNTPRGTYEYETPALTEYVRSQIAAGGAGKYLVLRLSARWWYGCFKTACDACKDRQYAITRTTERLSLTGAFAGLALPKTSGAAGPSMDPAALTELWAEALALMHEREEEGADGGDGNFLSTPLGVGVLAASGALAVAAIILVACRRGTKSKISPVQPAHSRPAVRRRIKRHVSLVVPAHNRAAAAGAQSSA